MKKIIFTSLLFLSLIGINAQGNLQFNQVFNYDLTGAVPTLAGDNIIQTINITVPANKVWKIESAGCRINYNTSFIFGDATNNIVSLLLDEVPISYYSGNTAGASLSQLPIWLNSGSHTIVLRVFHSTSNAGNTAYAKMTGIEFNVVP